MEIVERLIAPTPKFFRKVRNIGLGLIAVSTVIITSPLSLPYYIVSLANLSNLAGGIMAAVSQLTTNKEDPVTE